jgi:hypothetical protein
MGYSHYFRSPRKGVVINDTKWFELVDGTKKIIGYLAANEGPALDVDIGEDYISINGVGDDAHENLFIEKESSYDFNFVKTANKPYDVAVVAVLCLLENLVPHLYTVTSDGWRDELDDGATLASIALSRSIMIPSSVPHR